MGVAVTSRSARDMLLEAPDTFAAHFDLVPAEAAALKVMAADLAALMPGFVVKRERSLRRSFPVTLALLGDEGTPLVEDYSDAFAPVDSMLEEWLRFGDFVVEETRDLASELPYGGIIADVARFERLRLRSVTTEGPLWPEPEREPLDPRRVDPGRALWLHRSAACETFGWDVRTVRTADILPRLRPDRASLLCFQRGESGEGVTLRIDDEAARAVELIALRPGEVTGAQISELTGTSRPVEMLLGKLIAQGAVRGTPPW
jgi:hypothetical protein